MTDTPEKDKLEAKRKCQVQKTCNDKKVKKKLFKIKKKTQTSIANKNSKKRKESSSDDENAFCLVCSESYSSSRAKNSGCHVLNAKNGPMTIVQLERIVHHCESDDESFSDE